MPVQVNATAEGKFEDVEVAWGGKRLPRQLAELKFKQVGPRKFFLLKPRVGLKEYCLEDYPHTYPGNGRSFRVRQG